MHESLVKSATGATSLHAVAAKDLKRWLTSRGKREKTWLESANFSAKDGALALIPNASGGIGAAVLGLGDTRDKLALAQFSESLPPGSYAFAEVPEGFGGESGVLAWILGTYTFKRYRKNPRKFPKLVVPANVDGAEVSRIAEGVFLARDLINTPAEDLGPQQGSGRRVLGHAVEFLRQGESPSRIASAEFQLALELKEDPFLLEPGAVVVDQGRDPFVRLPGLGSVTLPSGLD